MPFPNPATQFKPGQTGNPGGHSQGRRVTTALIKLLEAAGGLDDDLARTIIAMATGRKAMLSDAKEDGGKRTPDISFMRLLVERLEGKVPDKLDSDIDVTKCTEEELEDIIRTESKG